ncbi:hypothetical protein [Tunturiibacter lichenicola]|uniref:hypothetical protein n=1 Tax=Tunturiibacter lichenicola TaxID=2051959 RepID=UPI003D9B7F63
MPLVFVHGVNVRKTANYEASQASRNELFRKYALRAICANPAAAIIENPYWGQFGANARWRLASLPSEGYESFGQRDSIYEQILEDAGSDVQANSEDQTLLAIARISLVRAVDCLWRAAACTDLDEPTAKALAEFSELAIEYCGSNSPVDWLEQVRNDNEFVEKLLRNVEEWKSQPALVETFGIGAIMAHLKTATFQISQRAARMLVNPAVRKARPWVNGKIAIFLGDVFVYLKDRDMEGGGKILNTVRGSLRRAHEARAEGDDKLVVIAHSMGGNIVYDILSHFDPDVQVDLFLTVGSQVGMFEELKLFKSSDDNIGIPSKVPLPHNIKRWINVIDPNDLLAYSTRRIFDGSVDFTFDSHTPVWSAHTTYLASPVFHQRLQHRISAA